MEEKKKNVKRLIAGIRPKVVKFELDDPKVQIIQDTGTKASKDELAFATGGPDPTRQLMRR